MIRLEMNKKQEAILAAIIIIAAFAAFFLYTGIGRNIKSEAGPENVQELAPEPPPVTIQSIIEDHIAYYSAVDEELLGELYNGNYTFENPLIAVNPYGPSPLTALVMFQTPEPVIVTVTVNAGEDRVSISHTYVGLETTNIIPIYGLFPGMTNLVTLKAEQVQTTANTNEVEQIAETLLLIRTDPLPEWLPSNLPALNRTLSEEQLFYFTFITKSAFDCTGEYRWFYSGFSTIYPTNYTAGGNILMIVGSAENNDAVLLEINLLGRIINAEPIDDVSDFVGYTGNHTIMRSIY